MPPITLDRLLIALRDYARTTAASVDLLLVHGLALQAYGLIDRATQDLDAEMAGDPEPLAQYLRTREIPADLGENMSGWSVVAMPPGYRERSSVFLEESGLRLRLLAPTDFVIAKLRRGTELDLRDAAYVANRFSVGPATIRAAAEAAIKASPKDSALIAFRKTVDLFCARLQSG